MDDHDYGYEIGADDIREMELSKSGNIFTRVSSYQVYNDYKARLTESEECKFRREMLKKLDDKLKVLKANLTEPDATFYAAAESMQKMLHEILKMKDPRQRREESVEEDKLQSNSVEELKETKVEVDDAADLKGGKEEKYVYCDLETNFGEAGGKH